MMPGTMLSDRGSWSRATSSPCAAADLIGSSMTGFCVGNFYVQRGVGSRRGGAPAVVHARPRATSIVLS